MHGATVYLGTLYSALVALDAATGEVKWTAKVDDHEAGVSITGAPLVVKDMVIVGIGGAEFGVRGFLDAYDLETGARRWRSYTVPEPSQPGGDTWSGDSSICFIGELEIHRPTSMAAFA
jgi:alcohol dehydrogenase (cytochrome c)